MNIVFVFCGRVAKGESSRENQVGDVYGQRRERDTDNCKIAVVKQQIPRRELDLLMKVPSESESLPSPDVYSGNFSSSRRISTSGEENFHKFSLN